MAVTLRVSSYQSQALGSDATRVFQSGGTIGRAPDNDWVLPDPERFVSGQHAVVALEGGEYVLIDHSTNGTVVNGRELPRGGRVRLSSGDLLGIGNYEVSVLVDEVLTSDAAPPSTQAAPPGGGFLDAGLGAGNSSVDPLEFFADPAGELIPEGISVGSPYSAGFDGGSAGAGAGPAGNWPDQAMAGGGMGASAPASEADHSPAYSDFFAPPGVSPDAHIPEAPPAQAPGGAGLIPEDWDIADFAAPAEPPPASWPPVQGAEAPPTEGLEQAPASWPSTEGSEPEPAFWPPAQGGESPPASRPQEAAPTAFSRGVEGSVAPPPEAPFAPPSGAGAQPTPAQAPAPAEGGLHRVDIPPPAGSGEAQAADLGALLRAAGLDPAAVDETALASLGEILRVAVEGLMDVLRARAEIKNEFRVAMTTLKPVENNPLKFSANAQDALFNLFARRGGSFKAPVDAFREAFDDLRAHQVATMAGMRAAFAMLMARFAPDRLQEGFDRGLKRGAFLGAINKTKYWELYREMYEELGDDDAAFRRLFGDEFARAYEEQMQRLSALRGKK